MSYWNGEPKNGTVEQSLIKYPHSEKPDVILSLTDEILSKGIFKQLSYFALKIMSRVCTRFKKIYELKVLDAQLFRERVSSKALTSTTPIFLHPLLQSKRTSDYSFSRTKIEDFGILIHKAASKDYKDYKMLDISAKLAISPSTTSIEVSVPCTVHHISDKTITAKAKNAQGVTVLDVGNALVEIFSRRVVMRNDGSIVVLEPGSTKGQSFARLLNDEMKGERWTGFHPLRIDKYGRVFLDADHRPS